MSDSSTEQVLLVIGGTGFAGNHIQNQLSSRFRVVATGRGVDIRDRQAISSLVDQIDPDYVVNLASVTTVRESFDDARTAYNVGFLGVLNLLEALNQKGFSGRLLNVSSSEVYGFPSADELPISEDAPLRPQSPYAVSKVATEALCYQWTQTERFEIVTARPFTHIGPGQSDRFSVSHFCKQIAEILLGRRAAIVRVGDLDATRDFTDVRDVVHAYEKLLRKGKNAEVYNVCSGSEISVRQVLNQLIQMSGTSINVMQDRSLMRNAQQQRMRGDPRKIREQVGWRATIPLTQSLADTLSYWRGKIASE